MFEQVAERAEAVSTFAETGTSPFKRLFHHRSENPVASFGDERFRSLEHQVQRFILT
jgi:hypothetical protein